MQVVAHLVFVTANVAVVPCLYTGVSSLWAFLTNLGERDINIEARDTRGDGEGAEMLTSFAVSPAASINSKGREEGRGKATKSNTSGRVHKTGEGRRRRKGEERRVEGSEGGPEDTLRSRTVTIAPV